MLQSGSRIRRTVRASLFCATAAIALSTVEPAGAQRPTFRLEEATIADVHRAILAKQLTATQLVTDYLKRIEAYNGTCVKGAVDPIFFDTMPLVDGWSHDMQVDSGFTAYTVYSQGKDAAGTTCTPAVTTNFNDQICFINGRFARYPEGTQQ